LSEYIYNFLFGKCIDKYLTSGRWLLYYIKPGDAVSLREASRKNEHFCTNFLKMSGFILPYIDVNRESFSGTLIRMPLREEIPVEINDNLVVEFYSR
jgi:Ribosomal protein S4 and related proteins